MHYGPSLIARKGAAPHCAAPPRLYFGTTRVSANRCWTTGYETWARFECSCHQSVPKCASENVGECARPRCYRTSVARSAGPNCTLSSLFTGLASLCRSPVLSDAALAYSPCSRATSLYTLVSQPSADGVLLPADGVSRQKTPRARNPGRNDTKGLSLCHTYSASARAFLATSAISAKVASSL